MKGLFASFAFVVAAVFAQDGSEKIPEPVKDCQCVSPDIGMEERLDLIARDNDFNNDGFVTFQDFAVDLAERYDLNNDGEMSAEEFVNQYSCAYGVTRYVAQYVYARIQQQMTEQTFDYAAGVPIVDFKANNRQRLEKFFQEGCVNENLDWEDKLALILEDNDPNGDGVVTGDDIQYDVREFYDTNKDGNLTLPEFMIRWVCRHGDSPAYASFMYNRMNNGAQTFTYNFRNFPNSTREEFAQRNADRYASFYASQGQTIADFATFSE